MVLMVSFIERFNRKHNDHRHGKMLKAGVQEVVIINFKLFVVNIKNVLFINS